MRRTPDDNRRVLAVMRDPGAAVSSDDERGPSSSVRADRRLRAVAESVADGLYVVEPHGRILYGNPAALDVLGYDDVSELLPAELTRRSTTCAPMARRSRSRSVRSSSRSGRDSRCASGEELRPP